MTSRPDFDFIVGFDFGHGETSVAMVDAGRVSPSDGTVPATDIYICEHSREPKITSLVGYEANGRTEVDIDIYDFKTFDHIEAYFKGPLIASDDFKAISDARRQYFRDFIRTVFNRVNSNPRNVALVGKKVKYYAACPSGWNKFQRDAYLDFLKSECELPIDGIIEESRAAHVTARKKLYDRNRDLYDKAGRIIVLDLGSSTLDITLHSDRTYTDGYEIGAAQIEETLLEYFLASDSEFKELYRRYISLYPEGRDDILLFLRYAKEEYFNKQKKYPDRDVTLACGIEWTDLSQDRMDDRSRLSIKGSDFIDLLRRRKLGGEANYEDRLRGCIRDFVEKHGSADAVILTGGASQMGFYKDVVLDCLGLDEEACIVDETPSYSISQGVAVIGYMDSKCPIFSDVEFSLPDELMRLSDLLPEKIGDSVLSHYRDAYTIPLSSMIDSWKTKEGPKTIEDLFLGLDQLITRWKNQGGEVSSEINRSVTDMVCDEINRTLKDTIRLYLGFDAKINKFFIDYDFNFSLPEEDYGKFILGIRHTIDNFTAKLGFMQKMAGYGDWSKDWSSRQDLAESLAEALKEFTGKWFGRYRVREEDLREEIRDCRDRLRRFYASTIKEITCQI